MKLLKKMQMSLLMVVVLVAATVGVASAQTGYGTSFITAITYQNVGTGTANIEFRFYNQKTSSFVSVQRTLNANAGTSLNLGSLSGNEALPAGFLGSAVMSSNQPIVATLVQLPQSTTVRNRPLSNGFDVAKSSVLIASVLKNTFNTNTTFSIQNAASGAVDLKVSFFAVGSSTPIVLNETNVPVGSAKYYDAGTLTQLGDAFNGSAVVEATLTGTSTPANIVASALELQTSDVGVRAFEGLSSSANTVYMATALCRLAGTTSNYAVQNTTLPGSGQDANVTVTYSDGKTESATLTPGAKQSFSACTGRGAADTFSGAATITSQGAPVVVIGKVGGNNRYTAFLGEVSGASKLALAYVRWTETEFASGKRQRASIAIQNITGSDVANVTVKYLDAVGNVVGTHTIASIANGAKANSTPVLATGDATKLKEFGSPEANPTGLGFGGSAIIEGPAGSKLIAVVRIASQTDNGTKTVAEDYNGLPVQ